MSDLLLLSEFFAILEVLYRLDYILSQDFSISWHFRTQIGLAVNLTERLQHDLLCFLVIILCLVFLRNNLLFLGATPRLNTGFLRLLQLNFHGFDKFPMICLFFVPQAPMLFCDNQSVLQLVRNPVFHGRMKHVEVDFHFVHVKVASRDLQLHLFLLIINLLTYSRRLSLLIAGPFYVPNSCLPRHLFEGDGVVYKF